METIVPAALLGIALTNLVVSSFRWGAGGKHQVLTSLLMAAVAAAILLPAGSGRQVAALWTAAGLMAVAIMTTPGARLTRMRLELALLGTALSIVWALRLAQLPYTTSIPGLAILSLLVVSAFLVMIRRVNRDE